MKLQMNIHCLDDMVHNRHRERVVVLDRLLDRTQGLCSRAIRINKVDHTNSRQVLFQAPPRHRLRRTANIPLDTAPSTEKRSSISSSNAAKSPSGSATNSESMAIRPIPVSYSTRIRSSPKRSAGGNRSKLTDSRAADTARATTITTQTTATSARA